MPDNKNAIRCSYSLMCQNKLITRSAVGLLRAVSFINIVRLWLTLTAYAHVGYACVGITKWYCCNGYASVITKLWFNIKQALIVYFKVYKSKT